MNFCLKEKLDKAVTCLEKPTVRNNISWNMGVYKNDTAAAPEVSFNVNSNTEVKLITVVAVAAVVVLGACICHRVCKMFGN